MNKLNGSPVTNTELPALVLLLCKDFPELVRKAQKREPVFLRTRHIVVPGAVRGKPSGGIIMFPPEARPVIEEQLAEGYRVTGVLAGGWVYQTIADDDMAEVAREINYKILDKLPEDLLQD